MTLSGQRSISVSSRHFVGHRVVGGARSAIVIGVALLTALVMVPVAGASSTSPVLKTSGPAGEGPYPWAYPASGGIKAGTGTTSSGATCTPSTPQFDSSYAPPCIAKFTGNNGGATYNGVTASTITLAEREFPSAADTQEIEAEAKAAGGAIPQVISQVQQVFLNYFNRVYDLYGRKVVITPYTTQASFTTEELGQGQPQACADADAIANQMHAFGETGMTNGDSYGGTGPFSTCAAQDHLVEFDGDPYFDEAAFGALNPYVWSITQNCNTITDSEAEVVATMLGGKKAVYAGDPTLKDQVRKFAAFVPNVSQYLNCTKDFINLVENKYHMNKSELSPSFDYNLDISTFEQSAQQAIIQFKAAGVTTVICSADPFSLGLLTKAAAAQDYHPEWFMTGSAETDLDQVAPGALRPAGDPGPHVRPVRERTLDRHERSAVAGRPAVPEADRPRHPQGHRRQLRRPGGDLQRPAGGRARPDAEQHGPGDPRDAHARRAGLSIRSVDLQPGADGDAGREASIPRLTMPASSTGTGPRRRRSTA